MLISKVIYCFFEESEFENSKDLNSSLNCSLIEIINTEIERLGAYTNRAMHLVWT